MATESGSRPPTQASDRVTVDDMRLESGAKRLLTYYLHQPKNQAPSTSPTLMPTTATPTRTPSRPPTLAPSATPSMSPTQLPSAIPSVMPSKTPTTAPTFTPSQNPSQQPTAPPTLVPSIGPTCAPSASPSISPTAPPTTTPSASPTGSPTSPPSAGPTSTPTSVRTLLKYKILPANLLTYVPSQLKSFATGPHCAHRQPEPSTDGITHGRAQRFSNVLTDLLPQQLSNQHPDQEAYAPANLVAYKSTANIATNDGGCMHHQSHDILCPLLTAHCIRRQLQPTRSPTTSPPTRSPTTSPPTSA